MLGRQVAPAAVADERHAAGERRGARRARPQVPGADAVPVAAAEAHVLDVQLSVGRRGVRHELGLGGLRAGARKRARPEAVEVIRLLRCRAVSAELAERKIELRHSEVLPEPRRADGEPDPRNSSFAACSDAGLAIAWQSDRMVVATSEGLERVSAERRARWLRRRRRRRAFWLVFAVTALAGTGVALWPRSGASTSVRLAAQSAAPTRRMPVRPLPAPPNLLLGLRAALPATEGVTRGTRRSAWSR